MVVFLCKFNIQNDLALKNKLLISLTLHFATKIKARELIIQMQYFQSMTFTEYHPLPGSDNHGQCGDLLGTQLLTIQKSLVVCNRKLGHNQSANSAWLSISADAIESTIVESSCFQSKIDELIIQLNFQWDSTSADAIEESLLL